MQSMDMDLPRLTGWSHEERLTGCLSGAIIGIVAGIIGQYLIDEWLIRPAARPVHAGMGAQDYTPSRSSSRSRSSPR